MNQAFSLNGPLLFAVLGFALANFSPASGQDVEQLEQQALYDAAEAASKYVVRIETLGGLEKVGRVLVNMGPTSGIVVDADGYIVSSAFNFIQDPSSIMVKLPTGKRKAAKIVSRDKSRRLVLLKVDVDEPLEVPEVASSKPRVGQWAITVGRTIPGDGFNMSVGIVSATNRIWSKAIQIDANVSPANYGGALVNIQGDIVGVLVPMSPDSSSDVAGAEWYDSGIGFCVPLSAIMANLDRMKEGDLYSGKLGISMKGSDLYGSELVIGVVRPKSPARDAGLKSGDKILGMNGVALETQSQMKHALGPLLAGESVRVEYVRDGETNSTDVVLTDKLVPYEHPFLGILPRREQIDGEATGVRIRHVFGDSPAAKSELTDQHVITEYNSEPIVDVNSLREAVAGSEPGDEIKLTASLASDAGESNETTEAKDSRTEIVVKLGSIPESVLPQLVEVFPTVEESNEDLPQLGKVNIKLPEEEGECTAYVPENYDPRFAHSLLVLLPVPGQQKVDDLIKTWKSLCDEHHSILLLPQAKGKVTWLPTETAFIRKTIENVRKEYSLDSERIAVMGTGNSGAMAFLTAFSHRDLMRGVVAVNSGVPRRSPSIYNEPLQRLAAFIVGPTEGRSAKRIEASVKALRELKLPVVSESIEDEAIDDEMRGEILRWLDSLDRI